ncbi:MAG: DUF3221 domain-containing protein [Bacilli bacterium]|nr:DUF3221 domain-containing protein [Bacilli bacterium]
MRKWLVQLTLFSACMFLVSCNALTKKEPDIHGFVIERTEETIFVVSKTPKDFSDHGGVKEFYDAIVLDGAPDDVAVGDEVRVWYKGPIRESYPLGGSVGALEIVETEQPEGAVLSRKEAVKRALENIHTGNFISIIDVSFDPETRTWNVAYKPIEYYDNEPPELTTVKVKDE